ncbi:hypothetical protein N9I77_03365 [Cyclobacteriaceae bacterium]|nr:hypothetical protein [Cyclobacteriaceae bacterium]
MTADLDVQIADWRWGIPVKGAIAFTIADGQARRWEYSINP